MNKHFKLEIKHNLDILLIELLNYYYNIVRAKQSKSNLYFILLSHQEIINFYHTNYNIKELKTIDYINLNQEFIKLIDIYLSLLYCDRYKLKPIFIKNRKPYTNNVNDKTFYNAINLTNHNINNLELILTPQELNNSIEEWLQDNPLREIYFKKEVLLNEK